MKEVKVVAAILNPNCCTFLEAAGLEYRKEFAASLMACASKSVGNDRALMVRDVAWTGSDALVYLVAELRCDAEEGGRRRHAVVRHRGCDTRLAWVVYEAVDISGLEIGEVERGGRRRGSDVEFKCVTAPSSRGYNFTSRCECNRHAPSS